MKICECVTGMAVQKNFAFTGLKLLIIRLVDDCHSCCSHVNTLSVIMSRQQADSPKHFFFAHGIRQERMPPPARLAIAGRSSDWG
jgi:hypothetical protein